MIAQKLINWYNCNKRDLPWRNTNNPYHIWISEIILQQTRVEQGLPYYNKFLTQFPTIIDLANAGEDRILKTWQGLGYYSRARNLFATAQHIAFNYDGIFPDKYEEIIKLKGIGEYTAAAIASFAYNLPYPVIDGNVFRVVSRLFAIEEPIDSNQGKKLVKESLLQIFDTKQPSLFNQAIMEFGALLCKSSSPECRLCPVEEHCIAFKDKIVNKLPVKSIKIQQKNRYFYYLVISDNRHFIIHQREKKDIWQGLWEFPLIETEQPVNIESLKNTKIWSDLGLQYAQILNISNTVRHQLTHQTINCQFVHIYINEIISKKFEYKIIIQSELENYAIPRLIDRYLHSISKNRTINFIQ